MTPKSGDLLFKKLIWKVRRADARLASQSLYSAKGARVGRELETLLDEQPVTNAKNKKRYGKCQPQFFGAVVFKKYIKN